jgi:hypothetical protein
VVQAAKNSPASTGSYSLAVDFGSHAVALSTFANSTLSAQNPQAANTMVVQQTGLFHFVLGADQNNGTGVLLTIRNSSGQIVAQINAAAGSSISTTIRLEPDTYTFTFTPYRTDGQPITQVNYTLTGTRLSNPMGTQPEDPTASPSQSSSTSSSGTYSYDSTSSSDPSSNTYSWYNGSTAPSSSGYMA